MSSYVTTGAPLVQTTTPGAEVRDALKRKTLREQRLENRRTWTIPPKRQAVAAVTLAETSDGANAQQSTLKIPHLARRFHLARPSHFQKYPSGIRKHKRHNRSHLATVVEKHVTRFNESAAPVSNTPLPIDRILPDRDLPLQTVSRQDQLLHTEHDVNVPSISGPTSHVVSTFVKPAAGLGKTGNSIRDHPSTWDHDSDQLAEELAAFALELEDENASNKGNDRRGVPLKPRSPEIADDDVTMDGEYVYETFVRVSRTDLVHDHDGETRSMGMLVIEEEDEELWQAYAEDDADSEWDEEDADSNGEYAFQGGFRWLTHSAEDNPRNDYPEDEVSSDDEYSRDAYKFRHGASDDEEYDLEEGQWSDNERSNI